jgi:MYXO-CTERM domain-containing protein
MNYRHVLVNQLKVDWLTPTNYGEVITEAVDEENADGRAFVTEYAGTSTVVPTGGVFSPSWDAAAFTDATAAQVGEQLESQGLLFCDFDFGNGCSFTHPLLEGLLAEYVTPPAGVLSAEFWANYDSYADQVDASAWNGADFGANLTLRVVEPGQRAADLVAEHPYLTRMFTTISPHEMTEDPQFWENELLPEVPNLLNGTLRTLCNGDQVFILPDGREVYLPAGGVWPDFPDEPGGTPGEMVSSQIIEAVPDNGAPMRLTDNTEQIDAVLLAWNDAHGWRAGSSDSDGDGDGEADGDGQGCGCNSPDRGATTWALLGLLGLAATRRRR